MSTELDEEIQEARALLYRIEMELDSGHSAEASYFASARADVVWKVRLIDLRGEAERMIRQNQTYQPIMPRS